ncbi:MAG: hypothetical protein K8F60_12670 [Melioribacteraceae bacterium]|jgi:hypothetical protein|nr:hypothetical protein [Melioribacteraceae bacterium]
MKKALPIFIILFSLFLLPQKNTAQDYAAALKINTLGISAEAMRSFGPNFNARLGIAFFSYSADGGGGTGDDYKYSGALDLFSISALADYFPWERGFRVSAGFLINLNKATAEMTPTKTYIVGGDQYTPDKLGTMNATVDFNKIAPYIGIGFGNPTAGDSGLGFTFDIGTVYQGAPSVDLEATGLISPSASPEQEALIEDNLNWFKWYPVVSFGLTYKF